MLKISPPQETPEAIVLVLIGELTHQNLPVLESAINIARLSNKLISLDLEQTTLVDRQAMEFLCAAKRSGISASKCPSYVLRWICQEQGDSSL